MPNVTSPGKLTLVVRRTVLDGAEMLDDDLLSRHGQSALGEVHRHDHRQHLDGEPHRDRKGEEERLGPVSLGQPDDQEHGKDHDHHEPDHQPRERAHPAVEARRRELACLTLGHFGR